MAKVTVLMPTYNVAPYVREAIESVLHQTFGDFILLVVDDASTDNTLEVVRSIDDPRIRIAAFPNNVGLADNLNRGLDMIDTELFARMDGDDIALPHWLQSEVDFLDSHPDVGVCGGGAQRFGTSNSIVNLPEWHEEIAVNMLFQCSILVPTVRMSVIRANGLRYRREAFPAEDYRFWVDCMQVTRLHNMDDILFRYRMHATQICSSLQDDQKVKVALVRSIMLRLLSDSVSDEDVAYFTGVFQEQIESSADLKKRCRFIGRIVGLNAKKHYYDDRALKKRLENHLRQTLYYTIVERWFADGYSIKSYLRYLSGGLALRAGMHYETRFLLRSILGRER